MDYLKGLSDGKFKRRRMDWFYHPYITENTEQVTVETIFNSFYNEGKDYDYRQEPENNNAGKLLSHITYYSFFIFGVISEI